MSTTKTAEPADKDGMTLDEIVAWAEEAKKIGIPGDARPTAVVKFGSARIKKIEVKGA